MKNNITKSWLKVFLATVLSHLMVSGGDVFGLDWNGVKSIIAGGIAAVLPLVLTYLDPSDTRWGRSA